jgi:hypothetical protein
VIYDLIIPYGNPVHIVLHKSIIYLGGLSAGLGYVILQEGYLIVVAEVFQQVLEVLFVNVLLLSRRLKYRILLN